MSDYNIPYDINGEMSPPHPFSKKERDDWEKWYKQIVDNAAQQKIEKEKLEAEKKKLREVFTKKEEEVAVIMMPTVLCPECTTQLEVFRAPDGINWVFRHHEVKGCSNNMTEFRRPLAAFTKFI